MSSGSPLPAQSQVPAQQCNLTGTSQKPWRDVGHRYFISLFGSSYYQNGGRLGEQRVRDAQLLSCFSHQTFVLVGDMDLHLGAEV